MAGVMAPAEIEARQRKFMERCVCDLTVSFQVVEALARGWPGYQFNEHICLVDECPHGYLSRLPGPLTLEAHEAKQRTRIDVVELMVRIAQIGMPATLKTPPC